MASITSQEKSHGREHLTQPIREDFDRELAEEKSRLSNQSTLWSSIREFILNINHRYVQSKQPVTFFQHDLHDLWYMFIRTAQVTDADSPSQDRLVAQLIYAKELLSTGRRTGQTTDDAFMLWTDLPYLVEDMREAWENQSMKLDPIHRHNFAAFTARLLALGVCDSRISWCALWLLREALETSRPLLIPAEGNNSGEGELVSVAELLPAAVEWFQYSSHKLLTLAVENHSFAAEADSSHISVPGELAQSAGVEQAGSSVSRWIFWRARLREICLCEDPELAKVARCGFDAMIISGRLMGYDIPGEAKYWAKVEKALEEELWRSGKASVSAEDICIDLGWVED
jgi:Protein of unknown function (DUF3632)